MSLSKFVVAALLGAVASAVDGGTELAGLADTLSPADLLADDSACASSRYGPVCGLSMLQLRGNNKEASRHLAGMSGDPDDTDDGEEVSEPQMSQLQTSSNTSGKIFGHPSTSVNYPQYPGFTLYLAEEFEEPLDLNKDKFWTWSDGGLTEGQVRFVKEQIQFSNGKMMIQVGENRGQAHVEGCSHAEKGHVASKPLFSGEMRSRSNLFRYGRYEVRMKAPRVQPGNDDVNGNYISTMFLYRDSKYQNWREIDFEITGDGPNTVTTNMLRADFQSKWSPGIQASRHHQLTGKFNSRASFHTYAFEWLPDKVTWYIDDQKVREQVAGKLAIPDKSGKIMMNLWIFGGGGFGGHEIGNNRYPMTAEYDYFRFYKWDGETHYPCAEGSESCLTDADTYMDGNNPCDGKHQRGQVNGEPACFVDKCRS